MKPSEIPDYNGPVGILVSGGADSALILYLAMLKYTEKIHIFTTVIGEGKTSSILGSAKVIHECIRLTGNRNIEQHISYVDHKTKPPFNLPLLAKEYLQKGEIEALFFGSNVEPDPSITANWSGGPSTLSNTRDPGITRDQFMWEGWCLPWINMTKKDIANVYKKYDLLDSLFPLTRSCVGDYLPEKPHCGDCWWCKEREWGFGKL